MDIDLLLSKIDITREQLERIVKECEKQRFQISGNSIRAVQGHSTEQVDISFSPNVPPDKLFHGTSSRFIKSIASSGLQAKSRQYVHLSSDIITAESVGKRHGGEVAILVIDSWKMHCDGFEFYLAENNVWLTRKVPPQYIMEAQREQS